MDNELLNASNSRVRTFHPVLELHLPEIVWIIAAPSLQTARLSTSLSRTTVAARIHDACRRTESSVAASLGKLALMQGPTEAGRNKPLGCWKLRATSISRFCQGGGDPG